MATPRILVADDDPWILKMVTTVLERRGCTIETADDGKAAYELAIASPPALLITDVMMPNLDGWALVRALRARPEFSFVPVIFLTALSSDDDRIRGFRLGADDYLPKPFRFEELDLRVTRTLRYRERIETQTRSHIETSPGAGAGSDAPAGLSGKLDQVGLSSLLTLLELEQKTGMLFVLGASGRAQLAIRNGRVVRASFTDRDGPLNESCVYELLNWSSGEFRFNGADVGGDDEVRASTTHLLIEGARRLDELTRA